MNCKTVPSERYWCSYHRCEVLIRAASEFGDSVGNDSDIFLVCVFYYIVSILLHYYFVTNDMFNIV